MPNNLLAKAKRYHVNFTEVIETLNYILTLTRMFLMNYMFLEFNNKGCRFWVYSFFILSSFWGGTGY
jgi:hypothetical protein